MKSYNPKVIWLKKISSLAKCYDKFVKYIDSSVIQLFMHLAVQGGYEIWNYSNKWESKKNRKKSYSIDFASCQETRVACFGCKRSRCLFRSTVIRRVWWTHRCVMSVKSTPDCSPFIVAFNRIKITSIERSMNRKSRSPLSISIRSI